ncbi:hypothetical protein [Romboutsia lituseburensis]|uniref:hypothetical protein n=1 Tax=Romboutsia lituseburensis TaxID=1537 RepID=UPI00215A98B9|nr:hypothetical protein [Romboutsia lituseburensis]MCR8745235.1 hypothetical protein [Romboutsia lituseburensis]
MYTKNELLQLDLNTLLEYVIKLQEENREKEDDSDSSIFSPTGLIEIDASGGEQYKIPLPSGDNLLNRKIDYRLISIIACLCDVDIKESPDRIDDKTGEPEKIYTWTVSKEVIKGDVRHIFNMSNDTFNKKLRELKKASILTEDTSGSFIYNYTDSYKGKDVFVNCSYMKLLKLINLGTKVNEITFRMLVYFLIHCNYKSLKGIKNKYLVEGVGYSDINNNNVRDYIKPLIDEGLLAYKQNTILGDVSIITVNKYRNIYQ